MDWMKMSKLTKKSKGWGRVVTKMTKSKNISIQICLPHDFLP